MSRVCRSTSAALGWEEVPRPNLPTGPKRPAEREDRDPQKPDSWAADKSLDRWQRRGVGWKIDRSERSELRAGLGRSRTNPFAEAIRPWPSIHSQSSLRKSWDRCSSFDNDEAVRLFA